MVYLQVKNRAESTLTANVLISDTTIAVANASRFPTITPFNLTIENEIIQVTGISLNTFTIIRAVEGTTAAAHSLGVAVQLRITAEIIKQLQSQAVPYTGATQTVDLGPNNFIVNNDQFYIDTVTGYIGISTTVPTYRLDVMGSAYKDAIRSDMGFDFNPVENKVKGGLALIASAGNVDAGKHYYFTTFTTAVGETQMLQTNPSSITTDSANGQVTVTLPISPDPRVTGRKIYRGKVGFANWNSGNLLATINNNTATTYVDNIADASLSAENDFFRENTTSGYMSVNGSGVFFPGITSTIIGTNAGKTYFAGTATGGSNVLIGQGSGYGITTGSKNNSVGAASLANITSGNQNSTLGWGAGDQLTIGSYNIYIGSASGFNNQTGNSNTIIGFYSGYGVLGASYGGNTFLGDQSGRLITTGGNNLFLGYQAGYNTTSGANNIVLGYKIDTPTPTSSKTLNIGNLIYGTSIDGTGTTLSSGNIGIGTKTPAAKLEVVGNGLFSGKLTGNGVNAGINTETLTANKTLTVGTDSMYQYLNPSTANWTITLDTTSAVAGDRFVIKDTDTSASTYYLTVKQGTTILEYINPDGVKTFIFDGTNWVGADVGTSNYGISMGYSANGANVGVALGAGSRGNTAGVGIGYLANGSNYGVAIGKAANANSNGVSIGLNSIGNTFGAALGDTANGSNYGVAVGYCAGSTQTGSYNVNIGNYVTSPVLAGNQQLNIGNVLYGTGLYNGATLSSTPVVGGKIGIGLTTPTEALDVVGNGLFTGKLTANGVNVGVDIQTLIANKTLVVGTDSTYQYLNPSTANWNITLDTTSATVGDRFVIKNTDINTSAYYIIIYQSTSILDFIYAQGSKSFIYDGTSWVGADNGTRDKNISIGSDAKGYSNGTAIGTNSMAYTNGTAVGYAAKGLSNGAAVGFGADGRYNGSAVGAYSDAFISGVALGYYAGYGQTGGYNINIGQYVTSPTLTGARQLNIGNVIYGTGMYNGSTNSSVPVAGAKIGIGTTTPVKTLTVGNGGQTPIAGADGMYVDTTGGGGIYVGDASNTAQGKFEVYGGVMGIGTLTSHPLNFYTSNSLVMTLYTNSNVGIGTTTAPVAKLDVNGPIRAKGYTVATLPTGVIGMRAYVTDATTPTYLGALTGGGAVACPVFYNGSSWVSA